MQIPSSAIAASVATVSSNSKAERAPAPDVAQNTAIQVEKSGESSADRDAQGQGDGMGPRDFRKQTKTEHKATEQKNSSETTAAPTLPDEPPSQLDLVG